MSGSAPRGPRADKGGALPQVGAAAAASGGAAAASAQAAPTVSGSRRRGRTIAMAVYYGLAAAISVAATYQVTRQVFLGPTPPAPWQTCREGLLALTTALERARSAASGTAGEDAALDGFRRALEPEWRYRDSLARICRGFDEEEGALDAIERLRYAEEHAVRFEAGDLAPLRRHVQSIVGTERTDAGSADARR